MTETTETGNALALFPKLNLPSVAGIAEEMNKSFGTMYTRIEAGIAELPTDMSIKANREKVASYAYSISRTKTGLDEAAAGVSSEAREIVDTVNAERRQLKTTLDSLRDKARAPLDAWEAAEKARQDRVEAKIQELRSLPASCALMTSAELFDAANHIDTPIGADEFGEDARMIIDLRDETRAKLFEMRRDKQKQEAEAAELEQLRKEKAEREAAEAARKAEEERKEREAAEAKRQEEERARIAKEAEERAAREAAEKIEAERREKEAAEQRAKEAEERAAKAAEDAKRREIEQAEAQKEAAARAEEEAKRREEAAKEEERQHLAKIAAEKEQADRERAADIAHRKKLNGEAVAGLMKACGLSEKDAQNVVIAIYKEQVPHVAISY